MEKAMTNMQGVIYLKNTLEPVSCDSFSFGGKGLIPVSNGVKGERIPLNELKVVWGFSIPMQLKTDQEIYDYLKVHLC